MGCLRFASCFVEINAAKQTVQAVSKLRRKVHSLNTLEKSSAVLLIVHLILLTALLSRGPIKGGILQACRVGALMPLPPRYFTNISV